MALRVALTAAACRTAHGDDLQAAWARVRTGDSALAPLEGFDAAAFGPVQGAQIWQEPEGPEDDPTLRILGPHGRILEAVAGAVHAADGLGDLPPERVGLFVGMGMVDAPLHDLQAAALASREADGAFSLTRFFAGGYRHIHPLWPLSMLGNVAAGQISIDLDIRGDNLVLASDADAGLRALLEGARSVARGACDAAIVGAVSGRITPATLARRALQDRREVAPGEGGAAFALRGNAQAPLAWLIGGATAFGPAGAGLAGPAADTFERVVRSALAEAGLAPGDLTLVFRHAEAPDAGQAADLRALDRLGIPPARVQESKSVYGHLGCGAPALDLALAVQALTEERLAPDGGRAGPRRAVILAGGAEGGAGALVVEVA